MYGSVGVLAGRFSEVDNDASHPQGVDPGVYGWVSAGQQQGCGVLIIRDLFRVVTPCRVAGRG